MDITVEQEETTDRRPAPDVTPASIFRVTSGFMAAKHLFVANEVGLFEELAEGPATLDELARRSSAHPPDVVRRTGRHLFAGCMV
jgi:hypothetical protein